MTAIHKATVIGAGVMGSGIAAHLANAGLDVVLLDIDAKFARDAVARQLKAGGFMHPDFSARITTGSVDDLALAADSDWIVEAIAEKLELKRGLYEKLEAVRKPGSIVSSNTSTIPLHVLAGAMGEAFARDFLITHFFNPPRHMRLLEVVAGEKTRPEAAAAIEKFADVELGKGVVVCKDTPGFIANRIGCFWLAAGVIEAIWFNIAIEDADALIGKPFGIPKTGVFGLVDLIGLDLMPNILASLHASLPDSDFIRPYSFDAPVIRKMIAEKRIGRKAGAGFYRQTRAGGKTLRETVDLASGDYRPAQEPTIAPPATPADLRAFLEGDDQLARYAWAAMGRTLLYAASLVPEIADLPSAVDEAMRLGYGWSKGPFELIDGLGAQWFAARAARDAAPAPALLDEAARQGGFYRVAAGRQEILAPGAGFRPIPRAAGVLSLADLKRAQKPIEHNASASLWDLGDGVACLEFHTKMNAFDEGVIAALEAALDRVDSGFLALVIGNDGAAFSAGANLKPMLAAAESGDFASIEAFCRRGQQAFRRLKFSARPSVAAVAGAALGGGCEVALHCSAIQAFAESQMGLVETSVGLIPAWGGCKELLLRLASDKARPKGPVAPALAAFDAISAARVSGSAFLARDLGLLRASDAISMNRERLLADAKARALSLARDYRAPEPVMIAQGGASAYGALWNALDSHATAGRMSPHDRVVGEALARALTGGPGAAPRLVAEDALYDSEREAFMALIAAPATQARIRHLLETGKPLRN